MGFACTRAHLTKATGMRGLVSSSAIPSKEQFPPPLFHISTEFLQWFAGFTDGEGNFLIVLDKNKMTAKFRFKINVHVDDKSVLELIAFTLKVGKTKISEDGKYATFEVSAFQDISSVIIPIFNHYPLLTAKRLNFEDFKSAVKIKGTLGSLSKNQFEEIAQLKAGMNLQRKKSPARNLSNPIIVTPYWFLGFCEAEGTFGIKNLSPYFQIAQKEESKEVMEAIKLFLAKLPKVYTKTTSTKPLNAYSFINKSSNVLSYVVSDIDSLHDYLLPFFEKLRFKTRKYEDFKLWAIALKSHKLGYFYLPAGRSLIVKISNSINKYRYSSNPSGPAKSIPAEEIEKVFSLNPPFDLSSGYSHTELAQQFARTNKSRHGFLVYVYKNGVQVSGSPFKS
jgi:hypothetical protein